MRGGPLSLALAGAMLAAGMVRKPEMVSHADLELRLDGPDLLGALRGVAGAGHRAAAEPPRIQPCTFRARPSKRALRRARGKARAA